MAVDDIVGLHIVGRYQSQNIVNTLHFKITAQTVTDHMVLQLLAQAWVDAMESIWVAVHIDSYELIGVKMFSITGNNKKPGMVSVGTPGVVIGVEVPSPVCRVITLYTDSANFRRRGRVMLSGCSTTQFNESDGAVTDIELLALSTIADALMDPVAVDEEAMSPCIPPSGVLPVETITAVLPRKTPGLVKSRRVRGFSIG